MSGSKIGVDRMVRAWAHARSRRRGAELTVLIPLAVAWTLVAWNTAALAADWTPYRDDWIVEIITLDPDGDRRETKVWMVVLDDEGYVRTNDTRWLANIRRLSTVLLRTRGLEERFSAEVDDDDGLYDRVEEAFKEKYGFMQKTMSAMRVGRPTVIRLTARTEN
jgi:hypothetical protein